MTRTVPGMTHEEIRTSNREIERPTAKQIEYLLDLVKRHEWPEDEDPYQLDHRTLTKFDCSRLITKIKTQPRIPITYPTPSGKAVRIPEIVGLWVYNDSFIRIKQNKRGTAYYADIFEVDWPLSEDSLGEWVYSGRKLADEAIAGGHKATEEEIASYGKITVHCLLCGRELSTDESKARGIGPGPHAQYPGF